MKSKVIEQIQERLPGHTTKAQANEALEAVLDAIKHVARNNPGGATIPGFGNFKYKERAGRTVTTPTTREVIKTSGRTAFVFREPVHGRGKL